jgi:hypothetical protein
LVKLLYILKFCCVINFKIIYKKNSEVPNLKEFDTSKDGKIDNIELKAILIKLELNLNDAQMSKLVIINISYI